MNIHNVDIEFNEGKPHKLKYNNKTYILIKYYENTRYPNLSNLSELPDKFIAFLIIFVLEFVLYDVFLKHGVYVFPFFYEVLFLLSYVV